MRLGLAVKLCLLAAVLVLAASGAGFLFYQDARGAVRDNELAVLTDEMEDRGKLLLADLDRVQSDLLQLAVSPTTRALLTTGRDPTDAERAAAVRQAEQLCSPCRHYLQVDFLRNDATGKLLAQFARGTPDADAASGFGRDAFRRARNLGPEDIVIAKSGGPRGSDLYAAIRVGNSVGDAVDGILLLRLDLAVLSERLNHSARVLGFLVGDSKLYLAHPVPDKILTHVEADSNNPLDRQFAEVAAAAASGNATLDTARLDNLKAPELAYYVTTLRIAQPPPQAVLAKRMAEMRQSSPDLQFSPSGVAPGNWLCRAATAQRVRDAVRDLQQRLGTTIDSDDPLRCETFAVAIKVLRPEGTPASRTAAPWFVLGLAVAKEEFEREIQAAHRRNLWLTFLLSGAAALAVLGFAHYLTRPLRQMIGYAERVAAGQESEPDVELPKSHGKDEIGTLSRAIASMVDQVRARTRELRESEARIRTILNTAAEGIVTIDEQGHLQSFNLAAERLFGYQAGEVKGKHFTKLLTRGAPSDLSTLFGFPTTATGGAFASYGAESSLMSISRVNGTTREVMAKRKNGSGFPAELSVSEVILGDRLMYTAILRDVTERKQNEAASERMTVELERRVAERTAELMQVNQSLESARDLALEANRAKDAFLAVMSHELRTPLNAIIGYCDYWLGEADEYETSEMLDDMRKMHVSGKHLLTLINDILDLAKIQAGKVTLELSEFEIDKLLAELEEWVQPLVRKNDNSLAVEASPSLGSMKADRTRVRQILLNLLSNASKFTQSGNIRLQVHRQRAAGKEEVVFRVTDTGVGMKPEDVRRLFRETFFQADSSSTRKHEGTGLGLVISHKLSKIMGGDIEVQSTLGIGTTFTVRLPTAVALELPAARERPPMDVESPTMHWQRATVVVIDDDPGSRELLEKVLRKEGYAVRASTSGPEAVALVREAGPAAIILDALSPNKDGWNALTALKSDPLTADIPIIMAAVVDKQSRGFLLGDTDFVTKPIDWERLAVILRPFRSAQTTAPILIVDDDPATRAMTSRHLTAQGWHVIEASNGREALEKLASARPALILLDLMMPEMDGFQFVERMRHDETWRTIPVVVVTAVDLTAADRARLSGSVQQILQKGAYTTEQLLAAIRERLSQCVTAR